MLFRRKLQDLQSSARGARIAACALQRAGAGLRTRFLVSAVAALLSLNGCGHHDAPQPQPPKASERGQLDIGYSLLYQEAKGIPKMGIILALKSESEDASKLVDGTMQLYRDLAEGLEQLAQQYPAVRIDVSPMSEIEGDLRKAIGGDHVKNFMPLFGKSGIAFERELLLMLDDALDEQRHLARVMIERETAQGPKAFLVRTQERLDAQYGRTEALLNRRYFVH